MAETEQLTPKQAATAELPPLTDHEVLVWRAALDVPAPEMEAFEQLLDDAERARAKRFLRDEDRRRFVAAHGLLRKILAHYLNADPRALCFDTGRWGKPALARGAGAPDVRFSISRSKGLALYAVARGREIGVDVEQVREDFDWEPIARRFFTRAENASLGALPETDRRDAFFNIWTCKEAYVKATGEGLSRPPDQFEIRRRPNCAAGVFDVAPHVAATCSWTLRSVDLGPGWAAAVVAKGRDWTFKLGPTEPDTVTCRPGLALTSGR